MDEVDLRYKDSIREALQSKNVSRLIELVPSLDEQSAVAAIDKWQTNYNSIMEKIRAGQDTTDLSESSINLLYELLDKAHLSGYHRS